MSKVRKRLVAAGFILLAAIGAATISDARQSDGGSTPPAEKLALRERMLALEVEVDLLQLEFDGLRATLVEWSRDSGKSELMGVDIGGLGAMALFGLGGLPGDAGSIGQFFDLMGGLNSDNPESALKAMQKAAKKSKEEIKSVAERKKQEFAKLSRRLHEKKLELAEAEKLYEREVR